MLTVTAAPTIGDFTSLLRARYARDPHFVHPDIGLLNRLLTGRSAYTGRGRAQAFVVHSGGEPRAFAVGFVDPGIQQKTGCATGSIGFFEALDEPAARSVIEAACEWLASEGVSEVWAPFNGNAYNGMGTREDRFDEAPFLGCSHQPASTRAFLESSGFELVNRYLNFHIDLSTRPWERFSADASAVRLRPASRRLFKREVLSYLHLHNAAFRTVWGEVEATDDEALELMMRSRLAIEPRLFLFAQDDAGEDVGFVLSMPDLNEALAPLRVPLTSPRGIARLARARGRARRVGLLSLGVDPEHQGHGIGTALVAESCRAAAELGFGNLEYALVAENNEPSKATAARFGGTLTRSFGIYGRSLG